MHIWVPYVRFLCNCTSIVISSLMLTLIYRGPCFATRYTHTHSTQCLQKRNAQRIHVKSEFTALLDRMRCLFLQDISPARFEIFYEWNLACRFVSLFLYRCSTCLHSYLDLRRFVWIWKVFLYVHKLAMSNILCIRSTLTIPSHIFCNILITWCHCHVEGVPVSVFQLGLYEQLQSRLNGGKIAKFNDQQYVCKLTVFITIFGIEGNKCRSCKFINFRWGNGNKLKKRIYSYIKYKKLL